MKTISLFCAIAATVAVAGCSSVGDGPTGEGGEGGEGGGGAGGAAGAPARAAPNTIVWTLHTLTPGGASTSTSWSGAPTLPLCPHYANFQAYGYETATSPSSLIEFSSPSPLVDWPFPGIYQLAGQRANSIGVQVITDVSVTLTRYRPDDGVPGVLTVDTYDAATQFITGTFQFDSVPSGAESQAGTVEGSFNFPCI